jgi:hypothetical protein
MASFIEWRRHNIQNLKVLGSWAHASADFVESIELT